MENGRKIKATRIAIDSPRCQSSLTLSYFTYQQPSPSAAHVQQPVGHIAAATGDVDTLLELAAKDNTKLHHKDRNGWAPIHEAARAGHIDVITLLLENGADMNVRTHGGKGGSPLNVAINSLSKKHPVSQFLRDLGAENIEPEL